MNRAGEHPIVITPRVDRQDRRYRYLDKGRMTATVSNNMSCNVRVAKSEMQFEYNEREKTFPGSYGVEIPPNGTGEITADFQIEPWATPRTNRFRVRVEYVELAGEKPVQSDLSPPDYLLAERAERLDKTVFISHSNSERD